MSAPRLTPYGQPHKKRRGLANSKICAKVFNTRRRLDKMRQMPCGAARDLCTVLIACLTHVDDKAPIRRSFEYGSHKTYTNIGGMRVRNPFVQKMLQRANVRKERADQYYFKVWHNEFVGFRFQKEVNLKHMTEQEKLLVLAHIPDLYLVSPYGQRKVAQQNLNCFSKTAETVRIVPGFVDVVDLIHGRPVSDNTTQLFDDLYVMGRNCTKGYKFGETPPEEVDDGTFLWNFRTERGGLRIYKKIVKSLQNCSHGPRYWALGYARAIAKFLGIETTHFMGVYNLSAGDTLVMDCIAAAWFDLPNAWEKLWGHHKTFHECYDELAKIVRLSSSS